MKLYHGGLVEVKIPRIMNSNHIGDFGSGFYTTTDLKQAQKFTLLKCARYGKTQGIISCYEFADDFLKNKKLHVRIFKKPDEAWARFVEANRRDVNFQHPFDLVYGPVANDQVYASFALYENELIDFSELLKRLKACRLNDQVLFHTRKSLTELRYTGSEVVVCPQK